MLTRNRKRRGEPSMELPDGKRAKRELLEEGGEEEPQYAPTQETLENRTDGMVLRSRQGKRKVWGSEEEKPEPFIEDEDVRASKVAKQPNGKQGNLVHLCFK